MRLLLLLLLSVSLLACSDSAKPINNLEQIETDLNWQLKPKFNGEVPNNLDSETYRTALTGNSHISGLGNIVNSVVEQLTPNKQTESKVIGYGFLDASSKSSRSLQMLVDETWSHIILQGQKYSQSRSQTYSTTGAEKWIALAKQHGITPILFPEHPQRGDNTEAEYVYGLHQAIVAKQASCIAPVGLAWDKVLMLMPNLKLHADDGNHASAIGKYLSALVFAEVITGQRVDSVTLQPVTGLLPDEQLLMAQVVSEVIYQHPACPFSNRLI
jgi:hypothetical protein